MNINNLDTLSKSDVGIINSAEQSIIKTVNSLIADCQYLANVLVQYRDAMVQNVAASVQESDILRKYNSGPSGNSYNLPGVFATTLGTYDLEKMNQDNERLESAMQTKKESEKQRNTTFALVTQTYGDIRQKLNSLANENQQIIQYIEALKDKD